MYSFYMLDQILPRDWRSWAIWHVALVWSLQRNNANTWKLNQESSYQGRWRDLASYSETGGETKKVLCLTNSILYKNPITIRHIPIRHVLASDNPNRKFSGTSFYIRENRKQTPPILLNFQLYHLGKINGVDTNWAVEIGILNRSAIVLLSIKFGWLNSFSLARWPSKDSISKLLVFSKQ